MIKNCFLISFIFSFLITNAQWPSIDSYRASSAVRILHDMEELHQENNVYKAISYFADIAAMVRKDVLPYPKFQYNSYGENKSYKEYLPDLVNTFNELEDSRKSNGLTSITFFSGVSDYIDLTKGLVDKNSERSWCFWSILDEQTTIIAAAGYYDLALKQLNNYENSIKGERAFMHLAVNKAYASDFSMAESHAKTSIQKIRKEPDYETIRQFFHLVEILGENGKSEMAMNLISAFPKESHRVCAKAYLYYGANNTSQFQNLITEAKELKYLNYPLKEIEFLGAKLKSIIIVNSAISEMNLNYNRQNPVYVFTELAKTTKNKTFLHKAKFYSSRIPTNATAAKADANIWIAIAELKLAQSENEALRILTSIQKLPPEYRIKFHLRWNGFKSQRFYTGYH